MFLLTCLAGLSLPVTRAPSGEPSPPTARQRVPVIDVTDLYHPHQDVGDNFDIIAAYALPEIDLRAVILDCTEPFRQPVAKEHYVWETGVWICVSGRRLVKRAGGSHRILAADEVAAGDQVLPNELHPCEVTVRDDGIFEFRESEGPSNFTIYSRGDPRRNEAALREALPALYLSFRPSAAR